MKRHLVIGFLIAVTFSAAAASGAQFVPYEVNTRIFNQPRRAQYDYLASIDRVTAAQLNDALRKYLRTDRIKFVLATDSKHAEPLAGQIRSNQPAFGKSMQDYQFEHVKLGDGKVAWQIPEEKVEMLRVDALWAEYPLDITEVRVVPVSSLFRIGQFIGESR
jgi:hypothetical protein